MLKSSKTRFAVLGVAATIALPVFGLANPASAATGGTTVPINGSGSAVETIFTDTLCPASLGSSVIGTEQLSHLGRVTFSSVDCVLSSSSTSTTTAANGDQLVDVATVVSNGSAFSGTLVYTGGTGRFLDASGTATISGTVTPLSASTFALTFSTAGTISY